MYSQGLRLRYWLDSTHVKPPKQHEKALRAIIVDALALSPLLSMCCATAQECAKDKVELTILRP